MVVCTFLAIFSLFSRGMAEARERTFLMVKPDGVQRGIIGKIIKRLEAKGFKLVAMKFMWASEELLKKHYADLSGRPFFPGLVKYMSSGPVVPMKTYEHVVAVAHHGGTSAWVPQHANDDPVLDRNCRLTIYEATIFTDVWEGLNVVKTGRVMLGATDPKDSAPGTIRGDLCIQVGRNIIHGSDSVDSANKEIRLWFEPNELVAWKPAAEAWIYED